MRFRLNEVYHPHPKVQLQACLGNYTCLFVCKTLIGEKNFHLEKFDTEEKVLDFLSRMYAAIEFCEHPDAFVAGLLYGLKSAA